MAEYIVSGPVAVLPTKDGSERYMYRGALISNGEFTKDGIKHALDVGLLTEAPELIDVEELAIVAAAEQAAALQVAAEQAAADQAAAQKAAAEKQQQKPTGK